MSWWEVLAIVALPFIVYLLFRLIGAGLFRSFFEAKSLYEKEKTE